MKAPATSYVVKDLRNGVHYGFTVTAVNDRGASDPSVTADVTPTANQDGEVERLIVAYETGVKITEAPGVATGSSSVDEVALSPGSALGAGMRTVTLSEPVDEVTAEKLANELTADPRVKWAEPDYFVPMLSDLSVPAKGTPSRPAGVGAQATKATAGALAQPASGLVEAQTACVASTSVEPVARCFDDDNFDAGSSVDAEIVWSDAYVTSSAKQTLLVDTIPWAAITDNSWLIHADTYLMVCVDTDGNGASNSCVIPQWAALAANQSTGVTIYDVGSGAWTARSATCSGSYTRKAGDHAAVAGTVNSWWQLAIDWSCLVGANASNVRVFSYMHDYLYPSGDYSPNSYSGTPMDFAVTGPISAPGAPTSVGVTANTGGLTIGWSAPTSNGGTSITGFTARAYAAGSGGSPIGSCTAASTQCSITGLTPGTTYWVDVVASSAAGTGPASSPRTAGIPASAVAPTVPLNVLASSGTASLAVSWSTPASNGGSAITGYTARAYTSASGGTATATCTTSASSCPITGLSNGTTYWVEVAAANSIGTGSATSPRVAGVPGAAFVPTDPYYASSTLWGLDGTYGVKAPDAWALTRGSSNVVVAVVDTGSTVHPDLAGQTVAGYDMISDLAVAVDGTGRDSDPSDPGDSYGGSGSSWHGTHVAGTINAVANNGIGVVGVAPDVKVQHVRVLGSGGGYTSDIVAGITWASGGSIAGVPANPTPARVINMSLGGYGGCTADWQTAIDAAVARGTVVVVAAGNSGADASGFSPASCKNVLTVAATGSDGKRAGFSNFGSMVEIAGPGVAIMSTLNSGLTTVGSPSYASYSGTSMATPHVAGVVALMLSRDPSLTPAQVSSRVTTAANTTAFPGGACDAIASNTCGAGIVNAGRLLALGSSPVATVPGSPTAVAGSSGSGQLTVSWVAPSSNGGSDITGYTARAFTSLTGGTAVSTCSTATTTCTIGGLANGTTHYLEVVATNAVGTGAPTSPRAASATPSAPGSPTSVLATGSAASASISWTPPASTGGSAITGYTARAFAATTGGTAVASCTTSSTGCAISGLVNGTTYYVDVVGANSVGTSSPSTPRVSVIPRSAPSSPRSVLVTPGAAQLSVSWTAPATTGGGAITGYQARAFDSLTGGVVAGSCTVTTTGCAITGLVNGTTYYVEVDASNMAGTSPATDPRQVGTPRVVPGQPSSVRAVPGNSSLAVNWTAPATTGGSAITGYAARAFSAASGGTAVATCTSSSTNCTISGLVNGTTYYVDVAATNAAGNGAASAPRVSAAPRTVPGTPTTVVAIPGSRQVSLSWRAPASTGGSAITVYSARAYSALVGGALLGSCDATATSCVITGLTNGTAVYIEVDATNAAGAGSATTPRVASTPRQVPTEPTGVLAVPANTTLAVSWTAPVSNGGSAITGYTVRAWSAASGGSIVRSCTALPTTSTCTVTSLVNGTTYYVDVIATNAAGASTASTPRVAATPRTIPSAPRLVISTPGSQRLSVSWTVPSSNGGNAIIGYTARAWSAASGGTLLQSCTSSTASCVIEDLANGTAGYVDVVATNEAGTSAPSTPRLARTPRTVPDDPVAGPVTPGPGNLIVAWTAPSWNGGSAITGYTARAWSAASAGILVKSCTSTASTCTITGLTNGTAYFVDIVAANIAGTGAASDPRVEATPRTAPAPAAALVTTPDNGRLSVTWASPASNGGSAITGYTARAWSAPAGGSILATCASSTPGCAIPGLTNGRTYYVDVVAANAAGTGAPSGRATGTPRTVPSSPVVSTATPGPGQVKIAWGAPVSTGGSPITGYLAQVWSEATGGTPVATCRVTTPTCTVSGLSNGTTYYVDVVASNAAGSSSASPTRVSAVPRTVASTPALGSVVPGAGTLAVSWAASANDGGSAVTAYTARAWSSVGGGSVVRSCTVAHPATACTITGLVTGATYHVDVTATNAAGMSPSAVSRLTVAAKRA